MVGPVPSDPSLRSGVRTDGLVPSDPSLRSGVRTGVAREEKRCAIAQERMAAQERKRPWYLVLGLLGALSLGTTGACNGWRTVALYRTPVDASSVGQELANEDDDRAAIQARFQAYLDTLDAAKVRGWPFGVAALLLGSAITFLTMRALGGGRSARIGLVQLVVAQAALTASGWFVIRDILEAESRVDEARVAAEMHARPLDKQFDEEQAMRIFRSLAPIGLVVRTAGSLFVVLALTRRRSREFFDATAAFEER
jgi:hypothetical protein